MVNQGIAYPNDVQRIATKDATNPAETMALVNELKAKMNVMIIAFNQLNSELRRKVVE